jgi:hypothetical protein
MPGAGRWDTIDEPATVLRNYHSSALLMPEVQQNCSLVRIERMGRRSAAHQNDGAQLRLHLIRLP